MSPKRLGRMLKTLREKKGLTQTTLAARARMSQAYVASLESGDRKNPSIGKLQSLAKALGVPVAELLE